MKLLNFTRLLYGVGKLNLNMVLSGSSPENFANIWQIKWNWIRSVKFEIVRIHFLSEFSVRLSSRNFATMGTWTWRNDSSLFFKREKPTVTSLRIHIQDKNDLNMVMSITLRQKRWQYRIFGLSPSNIDVKEVGYLMTPTNVWYQCSTRARAEAHT